MTTSGDSGSEPDFRPVGWEAAQADFRRVGWVTDQPGSTLRRDRNPLLLGLVILLLAGGFVVGGIGLVQVIGTSGPSEDDRVAEGRVAALDGPDAAAATFTAGGADPFTVWLQTDGIFNDVTREAVIASTACDARLAGGDVAHFQGNRQGTAVTIGDQSTIGWFTATEGPIEVSCRQVEFGRRTGYDRFAEEHDFVVVRGKPSFPFDDVVLLTVGTLLFVIGACLIPRWRRGRVRPLAGS